MKMNQAIPLGGVIFERFSHQYNHPNISVGMFHQGASHSEKNVHMSDQCDLPITMSNDKILKNIKE